MTAVNGKIFQSRFAAWLAPMLLRLVFIACIILAAPCVQAASGAAGGFTTGFLASGDERGAWAMSDGKSIFGCLIGEAAIAS